MVKILAPFKDMKDAYGGRRFLLTVASGTVASLLQWFDKLDPAGTTYAAIIVATVAAYITGNVMERKNEAIAPLHPRRNDPESDSEPYRAFERASRGHHREPTVYGRMPGDY